MAPLIFSPLLHDDFHLAFENPFFLALAPAVFAVNPKASLFFCSSQRIPIPSQNSVTCISCQIDCHPYRLERAAWWSVWFYLHLFLGFRFLEMHTQSPWMNRLYLCTSTFSAFSSFRPPCACALLLFIYFWIYCAFWETFLKTSPSTHFMVCYRSVKVCRWIVSLLLVYLIPWKGVFSKYESCIDCLSIWLTLLFLCFFSVPSQIAMW